MIIWNEGKIWTLFYRTSKTVKNNKAWEFQFMWIPAIGRELLFSLDFWDYPVLNVRIFNLFILHIYNSKKEDHAGFNLTLRILGFEIAFKHFDIRHWNYDEDRWETQEEIDQQNFEYQQSLNKQTNESNN